MSTNAQLNDEKKIFNKFIKHLGYTVPKIENRNPPEPDILCVNQFGDEIAFELVEILDNGMARSNNALGVLKALFSKKFNELTPEIKSKLISRIGRADVFIKFKKDVSLNKCRIVIPSFLKYLATLTPSASGEFILDSATQLSKVIEKFSITPVNYDGPSWSIQTGGPFSDPINEALRGKFNKKYKTNAVSIQLLAYYDNQPSLPPFNIDQIKSFIEKNIKRSSISDVWIFSYPFDKIYLHVGNDE